MQGLRITRRDFRRAGAAGSQWHQLGGVHHAAQRIDQPRLLGWIDRLWSGKPDRSRVLGVGLIRWHWLVCVAENACPLGTVFEAAPIHDPA